MKYRKKPVVIEALKLTRNKDEAERVRAWFGGPALAIVAASSMTGLWMFATVWLGIALAATGVWTFI